MTNEEPKPILYMHGQLVVNTYDKTIKCEKHSFQQERVLGQLDIDIQCKIKDASE
jgi:hypothetical protein